MHVTHLDACFAHSSPSAQVQFLLQDALSDARGTFQEYSQKASKLTGGLSKRSNSGSMQTSDAYKSDRSSVDTADDDEPKSGSKSSSGSSRSQEAPMSRTS